MLSKLALPMAVFSLVFISNLATCATFETEQLVIHDATGNLSPERFERFIHKADSTFAKVLQFWSTEPIAQQFGKINIEFDNSNPKANYSFFFFKQENGHRIRVVRVSGSDEAPHQLAHKLTSAVFPNPDKLIRNMMGEASEKRFGNPQSFPMCGFSNDNWVMALLQTGTYIPLTKLGPNHTDWGMEIENNVTPKVKDRVKQHASYVEAGSFGEFLIQTYGLEKIKQFNSLSRNTPRPWNEIYGISLEQLEAKWLEAVRSTSLKDEKKLSLLVEMLKDDPNAACHSAQNLTKNLSVHNTDFSEGDNRRGHR